MRTGGVSFPGSSLRLRVASECVSSGGPSCTSRKPSPAHDHGSITTDPGAASLVTNLLSFCLPDKCI